MSGTVLIEHAGGWTLASSGQPPVPLADDVDAIADAVRGVCRRVVLAPSSQSAAFVALDSDALQTTDRQMLTYELERSLPLDAEQIVADFDLAGEPRTAVAIDAERWQPLVETLEAAGVAVESICPAPLLALLALPAKSRTHGTILWPDPNGGIDGFTFAASRLVDWSHRDLGRLRSALRLDPPAEPITLVEAGDPDCTAEVEATLLDAGLSCVRLAAGDRDSLAAATATRILAKRTQPPLELRRGVLAAAAPLRGILGTLRWLAFWTVLSGVAIAAALFWRQGRLAAELSELRAEQRAIYREVFPNDDRRRGAVLSRLRSEHSKVAASRRGSADVPAAVSVLEVLEGFLKGLPTQTRSRVGELRIEDGSVTADVELNAQRDAGRLAAALEASGFVVEEPTTQQLDDGTITAKLRARWTGRAAERPTSQAGAAR